MTDRSAAGPALGYQYQADFALLELARNRQPGAVISFEMHDDVAWEESGAPVELLQLKHTVNSRGGLGDMSVSLWKTLDVWMASSGHAGDPDGPRLHLVSTGKAAEGSAAYALRSDTQKPADATRLLLAAALESDNDETAPERARFLEMSVPDRGVFISKVTVSDGAPNVIDLADAVRYELFHVLPRDPDKASMFMDQLWGWWRGRAIEMLSHRYYADRELRAVVSAGELTDRLQTLIVNFSDQGLPEWHDLIEPGDDVVEGLSGELFVHQLSLINYNSVGLRRAIIDFYRAVGSETRWLEHDFIQSDEVRNYERRLFEAWEVAWGHVVTALDDDASEDDKRRAGLALVAKVLDKPVALRSRDGGDQDYYYRGKHHMMASESRIGWHPEFKERLASLLLEKVAAP